MSSPLRKKIASSTGVPPSVLRMTSTWDAIGLKLKAWMASIYEAEAAVHIEHCRVIEATDGRRKIDDGVSYMFTATASPALCAIILDSATAVTYAARRMNVPPEGVAAASRIFFGLVCEDPVLALWASIAGGVFGADETITTILTPSPADVAGEFGDNTSYLEVKFTVIIGDVTVPVIMLFLLSYIRNHSKVSGLNVEADAAINITGSASALLQSVRGSPISVKAILQRMPLTIGDCSRLEIGDILPLSAAETGEIKMAVETLGGSHDIATGEMGTLKRYRALKLTTPIEDSFIKGLVGA